MTDGTCLITFQGDVSEQQHRFGQQLQCSLWAVRGDHGDVGMMVNYFNCLAQVYLYNIVVTTE